MFPVRLLVSMYADAILLSTKCHQLALERRSEKNVNNAVETDSIQSNTELDAFQVSGVAKRKRGSSGPRKKKEKPLPKPRAFNLRSSSRLPKKETLVPSGTVSAMTALLAHENAECISTPPVPVPAKHIPAPKPSLAKLMLLKYENPKAFPRERMVALYPNFFS